MTFVTLVSRQTHSQIAYVSSYVSHLQVSRQTHSQIAYVLCSYVSHLQHLNAVND